MFFILLIICVPCFSTSDKLLRSWNLAGQEISPFVWPYRDRYVELLRNISSDGDIILNDQCRIDIKILSTGIELNHFNAMKCKLILQKNKFNIANIAINSHGFKFQICSWSIKL